MLLSSFNGNNYFTGVQPSTTPYAPHVLSTNALTSLTVQTSNLSATNVPMVGHTIVATLPTSWYKKQYFTTAAKTAANPIQLVDLNGTPIQLPLNVAATASNSPVDYFLTECLITMNAFGPANTTWANATAQSIALGTTNAAGTASIAHTINWAVRPDGTGGALGTPMNDFGTGLIGFVDGSTTAVPTLTTAIAFNSAVGVSATDGAGGAGTGQSDQGATGQVVAGAAGTYSSLPGWSNLSYVLNPATAVANSYLGTYFYAQSTVNSTINAQGNFAVGQLFVYLSYLQINPQPTGQFLYTNPTTLYPGIL